MTAIWSGHSYGLLPLHGTRYFVRVLYRLALFAVFIKFLIPSFVLSALV